MSLIEDFDLKYIYTFIKIDGTQLMVNKINIIVHEVEFNCKIIIISKFFN